MKPFTEIIPRGLVVSCQAAEGEPLHGSEIMARMAIAAEVGGAAGIRANGPSDVRAIVQSVHLPVLGIYKKQYPDSAVYITPTFEEARQVVDAGAAAVAIDATNRARPGGESLEALIGRIHDELKVPIMADISTFEEGVRAAELGCDAVASTLSGYVEGSAKLPGPDLELVRRLAAGVAVAVVAEGRYHSPEQAGEAIRAGAHAVVVGTTITRPQVITKMYRDAVEESFR